MAVDNVCLCTSFCDLGRREDIYHIGGRFVLVFGCSPLRVFFMQPTFNTCLLKLLNKTSEHQIVIELSILRLTATVTVLRHVVYIHPLRK